MKKPDKIISVFGSRVGKEEIDEIASSINKQWIGIGPKTKLFEDLFAKRLRIKDFALLDSGSNSLYLGMKLLDLPKGSEVIVPSFTWIACAHAVVMAGCIPKFCDVDIKTQNMTIDTVMPCVNKKIKAIMTVHYGVLPVKMEPIQKLNIPIIEDATHAVDSKVGEKYCGSMGDIGIYSFDAVKNLSIGEAGGITAKDPAVISRARSLRYCGIEKSGFEASTSKKRWWEYNIVDVFPKMIPDDIAASIGLEQLKKLDTHQAMRKKMWDIYKKELASIDWLELPEDAPKGEQHSYFTFCIRLKNGKRDDLATYLFENNIYTTLRFHPLHLNKIYGSKAKLPNCEELNETALNIPLHPSLTEDDLAYIIEKIRRFDG